MDKNKIREALEVGLNYVLNAGYSRHKDDEEKEIREALAEVDTDDWIKVTDRLPEKGGAYIVFNGSAVFACDWQKEELRSFCAKMHNGFDWPTKITHWQPLPSNPKE